MTSKQTNSKSITDKFISELFTINGLEKNLLVKEQVKKCLLDYIGVTLAGSQMIKEKTTLLLKDLETGSGIAKIIGLNIKAGLLEAAFINGLHSHVAELDDGERFGMFHPGAVVFSALIPVAQKFGISEESFIKGVILGYEASIRLARSLQPMLKDKGFHGTGVCGVFGAAIAVGVSLGFTKQQLKDTLSAAATSSSGLLKVIKGRSEMKPLNVAVAAKNGLNAALYVRAGFSGPDDVLDGEMGFLTTFTGNFNLDKLLDKNDSSGIMQIYMKPYAACRHCHPAIEASIIIKDKYSLKTESIKTINVDTYYWAVGGHDHTEIVGINSAKMSTPFSVAVALETGKAGINEFSQDYINNEKIKSLTKLVSIREKDELTALVPHKRGAVVCIETTDNHCYIERVDYPKGEPETSMTMEEVKEKFMALSKYAGYDVNSSLAIYDCVIKIETNFAKLLSLI